MDVFSVISAVMATVGTVIGLYLFIKSKPCVSRVDLRPDVRVDALTMRLHIVPGTYFTQTKRLRVPGYRVALLDPNQPLDEARQLAALSDSVEILCDLRPGSSECVLIPFVVSPKPCKTFSIRVEMARTYSDIRYTLKL